jgi:hypothetical protein
MTRKMLASRSQPMRRALRPSLATLLLAIAPAIAASLGAPGCAASGLQGDVFQGQGFAFRIAPPPQGWERVDVSHASLAYRDVADGGTVVINGRCGVDGEDVPLPALTQHLFMRFTDREILEQQTFAFDRREALRTVLSAKLDGVPMKFDVWVLKKDGCVYDLGYMAAPQRFERGAAEFERFARGFSTVPTSHAD